MKKVLLICAALMLGMVTACEAEEEPAPAPFLPLPPTSDVGADVSEGDAGGSDVSDAVTVDDTATVGDTVTADDTTVVDEDQTSASDAAPDSASDAGPGDDAAAEDVSSEDVFVPGTEEGACKTGGNPQEAKFATVDDQTEVIRSALTECFKGGVMTGETFFTCIREQIIGAYGCTEDCAQCFAVRADCMKTFCWSGCIMSSSSDETQCADCQIENYCLHPFETCTGLPVF